MQMILFVVSLEQALFLSCAPYIARCFDDQLTHNIIHIELILST